MNAEVAGLDFESTRSTVVLALNNNGSGDIAIVGFIKGTVLRTTVANVPLSGVATFGLQGSRMAVAFDGKLPVGIFDTHTGVSLGDLSHNAISVANRFNDELLTLGSTEIVSWSTSGLVFPQKRMTFNRATNSSGLLSVSSSYRFGFVEKDELLVIQSRDGIDEIGLRIPFKEMGMVVDLFPVSMLVGAKTLRIWNDIGTGFADTTLPLSSNATGVAIHPKYRTLFVASAGSNEILSFDWTGVSGKTLIHAQKGPISVRSLKASPYDSKVAAVVGADLVIWCL
jgi:hypothetical protein